MRIGSIPHTNRRARTSSYGRINDSLTTCEALRLPSKGSNGENRESALPGLILAVDLRFRYGMPGQILPAPAVTILRSVILVEAPIFAFVLFYDYLTVSSDFRIKGLGCLRLSICGSFVPAATLERYTGRRTFPALECRVQYIRSTKTPSRIDLINALLTHFKFAGLEICGTYKPARWISSESVARILDRQRYSLLEQLDQWSYPSAKSPTTGT